jgi:hypothetical protein
MDFPYEYRWDQQGRKGQACKMQIRGKRASVCEWSATVTLMTWSCVCGLVPSWREKPTKRRRLKDMNSRLLEFEDGYRMVSSGFALKRR